MFFSLDKYGFKLVKSDKSMQVWEYLSSVNGLETTLRLLDISGYITIKIMHDNYPPSRICWQYKCENYDELEFLLYKGNALIYLRKPS